MKSDMSPVATIVVGINLLSLISLGIILLGFFRARHAQTALLIAFRVPTVGKTGGLIVPLYIGITAALCIASLLALYA